MKRRHPTSFNRGAGEIHATDVNVASVLLRPPTTGRREQNGERNGDGIEASNCCIKVLCSVATVQNNNDDNQQ